MWRKGDFPGIAVLVSTRSSSPRSNISAEMPRATIIALGVVLPLVAIVLSCCAFCVWRRRKMIQERRRLDVILGPLYAGYPDGFPENTTMLASENSQSNGPEPGKPDIVPIKEVSPSDGAEISSATAPVKQASPSNGAEISSASAPNTEGSSGSDEAPPPYTIAEPSAIAGAGHGDGGETDREYKLRRLKERRALLAERIRLGREEDLLRARMGRG